MKLNKTVFYASALCACFCAPAEEAKPADFAWPMGNFGLDCACSRINEAKKTFADETGISPFYNYYSDAFANTGGLSSGANYTHIMTFGAVADLQKIAGLKGASLTVSGAYNAGDDLSGTIGNFYTISQSAVTGGAMMYELYYTQQICAPWGDTIVVNAGRMSMSDTFASLPVFGFLAGGAMDATPEAIFYASPFTSSTLASWGATIQYQTVSDISFEFGLFQVPPNINSPQWRGTDFGIGGDDGYMLLAQASWSPVFCGNLGGLYQAGGYFFDGYEMAYLDGSGRSRASGYGFYLQGQQTVWACGNNPSQNITLWAGAQYAPLKRISPVQWQVYAGMQFQGLIPRRSGDSIFVSWTSGFFSGEYNGGASTQETVLELNYLWQLNANISLQPVLQFVLNPGGSGEINDAVVWGGQVMVSF